MIKTLKQGFIINFMIYFWDSWFKKMKKTNIVITNQEIWMNSSKELTTSVDGLIACLRNLKNKVMVRSGMLLRRLFRLDQVLYSLSRRLVYQQVNQFIWINKVKKFKWGINFHWWISLLFSILILLPTLLIDENQKYFNDYFKKKSNLKTI